MIDFSRYRFHPVVQLPAEYEVYDFTRGYDPERTLKCPYGVGRYNEKRVGMYTSPLFAAQSVARDIHMGIDIAAPAGTPVHAFYEGEVFLFAVNPAHGDYGPTLITRHRFGENEVFALHGHLSSASLSGLRRGESISAGQVLGWIGERHENGGWNPHLHFQLSYARPTVCDMPGVVSEQDRDAALALYPDPRLVLGPLYED